MGTATEFLQTWYRDQCDGDWEHEFGIEVDTLDNPGWSLKIDLEGTPAAGRTIERQVLERSDNDWLHVWSDGTKFHAASGASNLEEALEAFRTFIS